MKPGCEFINPTTLKDSINIHKLSIFHWKATTKRQSRLVYIQKLTCAIGTFPRNVNVT